ncbi:TonB-dependent receptor family protein [Piscinibacter koreensis]|uniref:TonB-dependent receptor family protein n=1 Tax=Piscinibacter koreensis TaxID=2742824 RepID=UPI003CC91340
MGSLAHAQTPAGPTGGAPASPTTQLAPVVVTATRTEVAPFDVPASIDLISGELIRDARPQVNISETLGSVPGLLARDRQNYAQDVQISVRGFGARSTFGIRGVRVYVDGVPATLPDGQGQLSHIDLGSADRIEVLRGPFSSLYGNSSGGVIQVFTEEGEGAPTVSTSVAAGSDSTYRVGLKASGSNGPFGYVVSASEFSTDGYRDHSKSERRLVNAKLTLKPTDDGKFTLVANHFALPKAQDPLGLTRAQFEADPRGVDPSALSFDTRKTVEQTQLGATYEHRIDANHSLRALVYAGTRATEQFQAIPTGPQASPLHPGGVIDLDRNYSGTDLRWTGRWRLGGAPLSVVAGIAYDLLREHRRGYQNFVGTETGVLGALRRDENNRVSNFDQYLQGSFEFAPRWTLNAGLRHSKVRFSSRDHYVAGTNPDDSGGVNYSATLPVLGLMFKATDNVHLYATAGRGFETPTLNELAYRANGQTGLNLDLDPARSNNLEVGVKTRAAAWGQFGLALFQTRTKDEIVTLSNVGGRSTFQNAGSTRRRGIEAAWSQDFANDLRAQVAYTWLDARYRDAFATCTGSPCNTPNLTIPSGNRIPGVARQSLYAALGWAPVQGWRAGIEARALGGVFVNDANSDAARRYVTANVNVGYVAKLGPWDLAAFGRVDNVFDKRYIGSVIVNEGNARYFEPAPGRIWTAGLTGSLRF